MSASQKFVLVISILGSIAVTGFSVSILFTIILPALMFICARRIRMQGEIENANATDVIEE